MPVDKNMTDSFLPENLLELVNNVKSGEEGSFSELEAVMSPIIGSIVSSFDLSFVGAESEDLWQEARICLYKAVFAYDPALSSFSTFAYICIRHGLCSALRQYARGHAMPLTAADELALSKIADPGMTSEKRAIDYESLELLLSNIESLLSPFEKKVLSFFLLGKPYDEIARCLGKERKSIDNALVRIRAKLRVLKN